MAVLNLIDESQSQWMSLDRAMRREEGILNTTRKSGFAGLLSMR
jgi:hypothetical protein